MQWLIDIIKEWIVAQGYLTTSFVDRGDPEFQDFSKADFNQTAGWHDLDLSGLVPSNASAVLFWFDGYSGTVGSTVTFREKGNSFVANTSSIFAQVADVLNRHDFVCPIGPDGLLEYRFTTPDWDFMGLTVKGWWL